MAAVVFADRVEVWHVLVVAFIDGAALTVKVPSRMALTLDLVGRRQVLSATAAGLVSMTAMAVVVPLAGGVVVNAFDIAKRLLKENKPKLIQLAESLITEETIEGEDLINLFQAPLSAT